MDIVWLAVVIGFFALSWGFIRLITGLTEEA